MSGDLDRLPELLAELRERIPEGNGVVKDLRNAVREGSRLADALPAAVDKRIADAVTTGLDRYGAELDKAIKLATEKVYDRFDTIMAICLGQDPESVKRGDKSVPDLIRTYMKAKGILWQQIVPFEDQAEMMQAALRDGVPPAFRREADAAWPDGTTTS